MKNYLSRAYESSLEGKKNLCLQFANDEEKTRKSIGKEEKLGSIADCRRRREKRKGIFLPYCPC